MQLGYSGERRAGGTWQLSLNITNLFDRSPPIVANYSTAGTAQNIPNGYDLYGRRYQLSASMNF
jgi:outer membrane receptor protein involved in Fe transport